MSMNLGLGLGLGSHRAPQPQNPLCAAIAALKMVTVNDGGLSLKLAPHIVYRRGRWETLTLEAVLVERDGKPVFNDRLRTYRVDDLSEIVVTEDAFSISSEFDPIEPEYQTRTICAVQPA